MKHLCGGAYVTYLRYLPVCWKKHCLNQLRFG